MSDAPTTRAPPSAGFSRFNFLRFIFSSRLYFGERAATILPMATQQVSAARLATLRAEYRGFQLDAAHYGVQQDEFCLFVSIETSHGADAIPAGEILTPEQWIAGAHRVALQAARVARKAARAARLARLAAEQAAQNAADIAAEQCFATSW